MIVRILCEDYRKDQYVVQPVIQAMMDSLGKPRARVEMIRDPILGSVTAALDWSRIEPILDRYWGMTDIFILVVDRDGSPHRIRTLQDLEQKARKMGQPVLLLAENAWQEIEVWALAGQDLPKKWRWAAIRAEQHPKETYFEPLVRQRGLEDSPGRGRLTLGREAGKRYDRVKKLCPEDVGSLEDRMREEI